MAQNDDTRDDDTRDGDREQDERTIRALIETWHRATSQGNVAEVLPLMAEDVVFLTPGRPPMVGRSTFASGLEEVLRSHALTSTADIREIAVSQTLAYAWSNLEVTTKPRGGGEPVLRRGPALSIFGRRASGGSWVLVRDANMLSSDAAELALKVDNLERELMADGPGGE